MPVDRRRLGASLGGLLSELLTGLLTDAAPQTGPRRHGDIAGGRESAGQTSICGTGRQWLTPAW